jgi:hypothetical protein
MLSATVPAVSGRGRRRTRWPLPPPALPNRSCSCRERNQARAPRGDQAPTGHVFSVLHAISQGGPPPARETAVLAHPSPRRGGGCLAPSPRCRPRVTQLCVWCIPGCRSHRVPRAPLAGTGVTRAGASSLIRAHAPDHHPPRASGLPVARAVFAGSRRSLLGDGPSRHHLCDPCAGARTPRKPADDAANYLTTLAPYLDCPTALQRGWPIATGILEGACRHLGKHDAETTSKTIASNWL